LQGWDVALEREVALKIISYELSSKQEFRDMFIKEARVISRLNHPNIAQIYSIGSSNQILYYAMEFIDGVTLKDILNREGTLNSLKGLEYLLTVCKTLEFIYRSGIVHRDIKPANIMINNMGVLKLVDFGVAKARDAKPVGAMKKLIMGTPLYMSPEQIAGLVLDHRSDMYSLGATFYHAFCGSPPFESGDFNVILDQHLKTAPVPLKERNAKIAPALSKIIEKMLSKDPNERYKDFQTIITALKILYSRAREARRG
jgi:eukaryotic-like serine/threonine-protein kinase